MLATTDYAGIAAVIAAVFAGVASLMGAWNARTVHGIREQVSTNGDPRTLGQIAQDVSAATNTNKRAGETPPQ
jgi:hypothetical protein